MAKTSGVEAGAERSIVESGERSSVRKISKSAASDPAVAARESTSSKAAAAAGERPSARRIPADRGSVAKLDRPSSRKLERASRPDLTGDTKPATKPSSKSERPSKPAPPAPKAEVAAPEVPKKRSWRKELFRAMFDALRDILRAEQRRS